VSLRADRRRPPRARAGFTLIEMLVVIAIIATLAALVGPTVFRSVGDSKVSAAKSQVDLYALALNSYRLDTDGFPTTEQGLAALREAPPADATRNWRGPYLTKVVSPDPWGRPYVYVSPGRANPQSFDLYTLGRDGKPGGTDEDADITSWGGPVVP
jgi:general secretion pathway protein G